MVRFLGCGSQFLGCDFFFLLLFIAAMDLAGGGDGGWFWYGWVDVVAGSVGLREREREREREKIKNEYLNEVLKKNRSFSVSLALN